LLSDPRQIRKSWYIFFFQIPHLPEAILRANDWEAAVQMLIRSSKRASEERQTFTKQDIEQYRQAWWQKDAMTSMIHWYRAAFRSRLHAARNPGKVAPRQVQVPTLMLWGKRDIALSAEMAQPSIDLCVDGRLILFEEASHWVQHDEANAVNQALIDFFNKNHTTSELGSRAQHWMAADS
jgi:pimeloyl-ACP methyl ester carboxylesterase